MNSNRSNSEPLSRNLAAKGARLKKSALDVVAYRCPLTVESIESIESNNKINHFLSSHPPEPETCRLVSPRARSDSVHASTLHRCFQGMTRRTRVLNPGALPPIDKRDGATNHTFAGSHEQSEIRPNREPVRNAMSMPRVASLKSMPPPTLKAISALRKSFRLRVSSRKLGTPRQRRTQGVFTLRTNRSDRFNRSIPTPATR